MQDVREPRVGTTKHSTAHSFPGGLDGEDYACNAGDLASIPGSGRSPGDGNGYPFQYSCLENPLDTGAWWATVYGVARIGHDLVTKPPPPHGQSIGHTFIHILLFLDFKTSSEIFKMDDIH